MRKLIILFSLLLIMTGSALAQITKDGENYTFRKKYPEGEKLSYQVLIRDNEKEIDSGTYSLEYKLMKLDEEFHVLSYEVSLNSLIEPLQVSLVTDERGLAEEENKYPDYAESKIYYAVIGESRLPEEAIAIGTKWGDNKAGDDQHESLFRFNGIEKDGETEVAVLEMSFTSADKFTVITGDLKVRTDDGTLHSAKFNRHRIVPSYDTDGKLVQNDLETIIEVSRQ